jgi:predicted alpha-1,2-mannosidase
MKHRFCYFGSLIFLLSCTQKYDKKLLVDYVNPLIGTAPATTISALKHGHGTENNAQVIPAVTHPFGMTNWTPQTRSTENKCVAPYYYKDSVISGFRGSHWLSGSCTQDYGSMTIMPISGDLVCLTEKRGSKYNHENEEANPYNYKVYLSDYFIDVEMSATKRCGFLKFTFEKAGLSHVVINPNSDEGLGYVRIIPEKNEIVGYNPVHRIYQGWGEKAGFSGYFVARFSKKFDSYGVFTKDKIILHDSIISNEPELGGYFTFNAITNEVIDVAVGTSFTSIEQARKNLDAEIGNKNLKDIQIELKEKWEKTLSKIEVEGENEDDKVIFYTALYHSFLQPRLFNDADGSYMNFSRGDTVLNAGQNGYYVDFSMWDTYRALHPLFNLIMPEENADMEQSLLVKARQGGWLPIFPCWNSYTSAMIGDHAIVTLADAYLKDNIDISMEDYKYLLQNAFESPKHYSEYKQGKGRRALDSYIKYGYIPLEDSVLESFHKNEQVSRTLEYAFDDFALGQIAQKLEDTAIASILFKRALNYKNVYDAEDTCVKGRFVNGDFTTVFDKYNRMPYITEGTPWQYTWYVPHDIKGLMSLMGGKDEFSLQLDKFHASGQYWHGNEPGHQIPFLYNFCGHPWKTQKLVSSILDEEYSSQVGGLSGNDDAGQMSAWYVFATLGFYPVCPSVPEYIISGPKFDRITMNFDNGKKLVIESHGASSGKKYIQNVMLNGEKYDFNYLNHFDIIKGGKLVFEMDDKPNKDWGTENDSYPFSMSIR